MIPAPSNVQGWSLDRILGSGGFGIVELWGHKSGRKVAIKICKKDVAHLTEAQKKRWFNEVQIMKRLKHPNIIKGLEIPFKHPDDKIDLPVLYMEFCRKGDLRKVLDDVQNCCGVNEREAITIMKNISSAVEYLHSNKITHRDLKPENIVLQEEHNNISYKLIDLGYAKELGDASISGSIVGTLNYVAPELLWKQTYSCSVDYWSLGILFYELITGTRPFLPTMQHTISWMQFIKNKEYADIRAYKLDGKVIFGQDIVSSTNLSRCLRDKLVEWFRVVLQWDPKERGKQYDNTGTSKLVVFKLLQSILSKEIVYVFCASTYKTNTYEVNSTTKAIDLQCMIESDTGIPISQQTLTDYFGKILTDHQMPLLSQIKDPILFVFRTESPLIMNLPPVDIPLEVQKMLELSGNEMDFNTLQDYYRVSLFFMNKEIHMFQLYVFAITINMDLIITRVNMFNENMTNTLSNVDNLLKELHALRAKLETRCINKDRIADLKINFEKVTNLVKATNQVKLKFNPLIMESNKLKESVASIDYVKDLSALYNKAINIYQTHRDERSHKHKKPVEIVKLVFEFLKIRETQFQISNIPRIINEISKLKMDLQTLESIFDSVTAMTAIYRQELQNTIQCTYDTFHIFNKESVNTYNSAHETIKVSVSNSLIEVSKEFKNTHSSNTSLGIEKEITNVNSDVIYDNLVLRYTLDNLLVEMQKKLVELLSLET